ncbi:type II secretion system protein [Candidatus Woesebacteria bacterium]|nr:type II secretion system protein [Candidatus Woesebacteria bacterium]
MSTFPQMPRWVSSFRSSRIGFTLIELLVVIAILGILAVAVLSTINPIEQINRSRDTRTRSDAAEVLSAAERYYASREIYPWNVVPSGTNTLPATGFYWNASSSTNNNWLTELQSSDEVKANLITRVSSDRRVIIIKSNTAAAITYVCFQPTSSALKAEAKKSCNGSTTVTLSDGGSNSFNKCAANAEYLCLP